MRARVERSRVACAGVYAMPARAGWGRVHVGAALQGLSSQNDLARRRSESGRGGGWGLRLVAVTTCGAADRPIRSASARAATPGSLAGMPLSDGVGWVKVTVRRRRYFVRRRRHVRQDSSRVFRDPHAMQGAACCMRVWCLDAAGRACGSGPAAAETAAGLAGIHCGMRKRLRLMRCVIRTVRNDAHPRTFRTLADVDYRDNPP